MSHIQKREIGSGGGYLVCTEPVKSNEIMHQHVPGVNTVSAGNPNATRHCATVFCAIVSPMIKSLSRFISSVHSSASAACER